MSVVNNLNKRIRTNNNFHDRSQPSSGSSSLGIRLGVRGGPDQWIRMRQDKLKSLKKALLYSYQSAVVQKYNVTKHSQANYIINLITKLQDQAELTEIEVNFLNNLEEQYNIQSERGTSEYIDQLEQIVDGLVNAEPLFRCLINHDKLKVDYEDKIISIPFQDIPLDSNVVQDTDFHNGTVFKWVHGNKEQWTPDTYWIVYMQYSEQTAYFRAEIRKADEQIEIITVDDQGNETSSTYRGWMTGPNETSILWHTKRNVTWNDLNYTKILYITKDENTLAFFQRFDRVIINGKPWQVQAYNDSYTKGKDYTTGIIRVALKETYTNTDQFVKETLQDLAEDQSESDNVQPYIEGPTSAKPYDTLTFKAKNFNSDQVWSISDPTLAKIISYSQNNTVVKVDILTGMSNSTGFDINYGSLEDTKLHVVIKSF